MISVCDQLYRAAGSISANLEEGYSKKSNLDRARYFEYSLGSARETRGWYFRACHSLSDGIFKSRLILLTEIIKLLIHIVPTERGEKVKEPTPEYSPNLQNSESETIESLEVTFPAKKQS